jgi:hypothetical protein
VSKLTVAAINDLCWRYATFSRMPSAFEDAIRRLDLEAIVEGKE